MHKLSSAPKHRDPQRLKLLSFQVIKVFSFQYIRISGELQGCTWIRRSLGRKNWKEYAEANMFYLTYKKFWKYFSSSKYDLWNILLIFSTMIYFHLHQGQHLKSTLDTIHPIGEERTKRFAVTLNTVTDSQNIFLFLIKVRHYNISLIDCLIH